MCTGDRFSTLGQRLTICDTIHQGILMYSLEYIQDGWYKTTQKSELQGQAIKEESPKPTTMHSTALPLSPSMTTRKLLELRY